MCAASGEFSESERLAFRRTRRRVVSLDPRLEPSSVGPALDVEVVGVVDRRAPPTAAYRSRSEGSSVFGERRRHSFSMPTSAHCEKTDAEELRVIPDALRAGFSELRVLPAVLLTCPRYFGPLAMCARSARS